MVFNRGEQGSRDIYIYEINNGGIIQITIDLNDDGTGSWSPDGTHIAFHSNRNGEYHIYTNEFVSSGIQEFNTEAYKLNVYPSPFNTSTTIEYELFKETNVEIRISDLFSQEIWAINKGIQKPGKYSFVWNGDNKLGKPISTGIYYCTIQTGSSSQSIQIIKTTNE